MPSAWPRKRGWKGPLRHVEKVQTNGKQARPRRAFTRDEIPRLLAAAGPRNVIYLTAVHTDLRRKELKLMETDDLHLDAEQPFVNVRPATTKNHKQAVIALHPDVVAELRKLPLLPGKVFANGLPKMETFRRDLRRAGIEFIDAKGRRADFHSLRHTLGINLALAGTAPRVAMEAMRHSDIRLTSKTYTDTGFAACIRCRRKVAFFPRLSGKRLTNRLTNFVPEGSSLVQPCHQLDKWEQKERL
jgi:integrase